MPIAQSRRRASHIQQKAKHDIHQSLEIWVMRCKSVAISLRCNAMPGPLRECNVFRVTFCHEEF